MKWKAIRTFFGIFTAVFIVGYLTVSVAGAAESGVVTVVEYGYDSDSKEVNDFWNCATASGVTCAYDSSVDAGGSAGSGSLHITTQKDNSIWGNQFFTLDGSGSRVTFDKDTDYVVSMDVKSSADGEISLLGANPNFVVNNSSKKISVSDGWIRYEVRVCFDSSNTTYFIVGSGAEYWFDNIKIIKYPSKPKLDNSEPENGEVITPSSTITLRFNNEMNDDSVLNSANYLLNGKKSVSEVIKKDEKNYVLKLDRAMIPDTDYVLRVEGLVDIYGQDMENFSKVRLSEKERKIYDTFRKELVVSLNGEEIDAGNAAALSGKLSQMANGAVYGTDKAVHILHDRKLEALEDLIEYAGKPVLIAYWFKHDLERIHKRFKVRELKSSQDMADWNSGKIPVAVIQPESAGHGLNLQAGGSILIWFGLTWSLEYYQQTVARLYRQGQKKDRAL